MRYILPVVCVVAAVAVPSSTAQIQNQECEAAQIWHLQQAMKVANQQAQGYHVNAADAAGDLALKSGSQCAGWKQWATGANGWSAP